MSKTGVRFAPSPTGTFHVGNLRTAWVSYKLAKHYNLPWIVRFEDIDQPRNKPGARESQLNDMQALGLVPNEIILQSTRYKRHQSLFDTARSLGAVYACSCSRKEITEALRTMASAPHGETPLYNGHCRDKNIATRNTTVGWRFKSHKTSGVDDVLIGRATSNGDNFMPAYHWACAIDDYDGDYTWLVRAWDLAPALRPQKEIFDWIATVEDRRTYPKVFHTALIIEADGKRLEKRTQGVTLAELNALGVSVSMITERFEKSFDGFSSDGETKKTIELDALNLYEGL